MTTHCRIRDLLSSGKLTTELIMKTLGLSELAKGDFDPEAVDMWRSLWLLVPSEICNFPAGDLVD